MLQRCDRIFDRLMDKVGGINNVVFSPPCTEAIFETTQKNWVGTFTDKGKLESFSVSFFVKDISKVSEDYKDQVEIYHE